MYQQQDTVHHVQPVVEGQSEEILEESSATVTPIKPAKPRHPYQVLRQLPPDATPAQQDSAIQAVFQPENIRYSSRPDTLHIPGYGKGKSYKDKVELPQYYRENFFSKDSLLHPEISGGRYGMAGDPIPYSMRSDDVITGLLLGCFVLAIIAITRSRQFIYRQAKNFFYIPRSENVTEITETASEYRFQFFLVLEACLLCGLLAFLYTETNIADTFILKSQYQLIGIFFGCFLAYFLLKLLFYTILNTVFFDKKKNGQWIKSQLFIWSMMGIALFPLVLLQSYFDLSMQSSLIYAAIIIILVKILTFYKCYVIFFRQNAFFLQIILYFCALEIVPMLILFGILAQIVDYLKINF